MNHNELVAKIDSEGEFLVQFFDSKPRFISALRAVVKLHQPRHNKTEDYEWFDCDHCQELFETDYPCPTIKAIVKELS